MRSVKIKPIKSINEVKECFNLFKRILLSLNETELGVFTSFHETYQAMIENLDRKQKLQFYADFNGSVVGCVIAVPDRYNTKNLFMPVITVDEPFRRSGIASRLMDTLCKSVQKECKKIIIKASPTFGEVLTHLEFKPILCVEPLEPLTIDDVKNCDLGIKPLNSTTARSVHYAVDKADETLIRLAKAKLKKVYAYYIFERTVKNG